MSTTSKYRIQTKRAPSSVALLVREGGGLVTFQVDIAIAPKIRVNDGVQWCETTALGENTFKWGSVVSKYGSTDSCFLVVSPSKRAPPPARPAAA